MSKGGKLKTEKLIEREGVGKKGGGTNVDKDHKKEKPKKLKEYNILKGEKKKRRYNIER